MRTFNNKKVELLAPAGNYNILYDLINTPCDAFYVGGKMFNMRMHRHDFNFSQDELKNAVELSHENEKRIYVTVNNLMTDFEISSCLDYLFYLEELKPDGIIIQDFGIASMIGENNISLPMHSSVMMNVHNEEMVKKLYSFGITRTVVSREIDLHTISGWSKSTPMEFEYFVHGDMCSVHGSQCYYSNFTFGQSSNRGLCMKPCRWQYKIRYNGDAFEPSFPLAVKDMYMYENIPELIYAGICSFKIEGRMRESDYLAKIIKAYGNTIDRFIEDPIYYDRETDKKELYEHRMRDFSTGYAFRKPQLDFNNHRYEGTGYFYSTGKVFSHPIEEHSIHPAKLHAFEKMCSDADMQDKKTIPLLSVRVDTLQQLKMCVAYEVDFIYINTENFVKEHGLNIESILALSENKGNSKLILALPKMTVDDSFEKFDAVLHLPSVRKSIDGLMVSNIGALERYKHLDIPLYGDITLNIYNNTAKAFYLDQGLKNIPLSIEMKRKELLDFAKHHHGSALEIVAHGSPTIMYLDLDVYLNTLKKTPLKLENNKHFSKSTLVLVDDEGFEHPVYRDNMGRNHMMLYKDICLMPLVKPLLHLGVSIFRLEIAHYSTEDLEKVVKAYRDAFHDMEHIKDIYQQLVPNHMGFSLGSLYY
ncbi:MAG: U32 family peptidase [Eubacteriales bacterium]